jgi:hypothetical protein
VPKIIEAAGEQPGASGVLGEERGRGAGMAKEREPYPLALIVCDGIHIDPATGKRTLLGLFSTVVGREFPIHLRLSVYAALTDCMGTTTVEIRIVDVNEERVPVFVLSGEIEANEPLAVQDLSFFIPLAVFPEPGEYRVQLFAAGIPIMERRLMAVQTPTGPTEEPTHE